MKTYYVYFTTNPGKTTLYIGVTNDLGRRLQEHFANRGKPASFAGKYHCYQLVYFERYTLVNEAIQREKELKKWRRSKKEALIEAFNPEWNPLNEQFVV